jgi:predicted nucleotidyltransferase
VLLKNIKYSDASFNLFSKDERNGESDIDLIVDLQSRENNPTIFIVQNNSFSNSNLKIGVITIDVNNNKCYFMVDISRTQENQSKEK